MSQTETFNIAGAAARLGCSTRTAYRYTQRGTLRPTRTQPLRFRQSNVNAAARRIAAAAK